MLYQAICIFTMTNHLFTDKKAIACYDFLMNITQLDIILYSQSAHASVRSTL